MVMAVLFTVSVAVTAVAPVIAGGVVTEQVGVSVAFAGVPVTAQASETAPVKPPLGVTVMVDVAGVPGVTFVMATPLSAKLGTVGTVTTTGMLVLAVRLPEVPRMLRE